MTAPGVFFGSPLKLYKTLTFGMLRIDFVDSKTGNGILFGDGKIYSFR